MPKAVQNRGMVNRYTLRMPVATSSKRDCHRGFPPHGHGVKHSLAFIYGLSTRRKELARMGFRFRHGLVLLAPLTALASMLAAIFICSRRLGLWPQLLVTVVCSGCHPRGSISLQPAPISKSKPEGVTP